MNIILKSPVLRTSSGPMFKRGTQGCRPALLHHAESVPTASLKRWSLHPSHKHLFGSGHCTPSAYPSPHGSFLGCCHDQRNIVPSSQTCSCTGFLISRRRFSFLQYDPDCLLNQHKFRIQVLNRKDVAAQQPDQRRDDCSRIIRVQCCHHTSHLHAIPGSMNSVRMTDQRNAYLSLQRFRMDGCIGCMNSDTTTHFHAPSQIVAASCIDVPGLAPSHDWTLTAFSPDMTCDQSRPI